MGRRAMWILMAVAVLTMGNGITLANKMQSDKGLVEQESRKIEQMKAKRMIGSQKSKNRYTTGK